MDNRTCEAIRVTNAVTTGHEVADAASAAVLGAITGLTWALLLVGGGA